MMMMMMMMMLMTVFSELESKWPSPILITKPAQSHAEVKSEKHVTGQDSNNVSSGKT
jgi:hypothetical protein